MQTVYEARWVLVEGALLTIQLFVVASSLATAMALAAAILRMSKFSAIRAVAIGYVELFRGTSLVVQLFWLYYALPLFGVRLDTFTAATIGLGLCFGAYGSEIVRGAIAAVDKTQRDAALALNMTPLQTMRRIVFPQAVVAMLPPYGNLLILLLKGTAAAALISLPELTFQASSVNYQAQATLEIFTVILLAYFVLAQVVARGVNALEFRLGKWRKR